MFARDVRRPNITGEYGNYPTYGVIQDRSCAIGAFYAKTEKTNGMIGGPVKNWTLGLNASNSASTYGSSSTVQPASIRSLLCIKI